MISANEITAVQFKDDQDYSRLSSLDSTESSTVASELLQQKLSTK